MIASQSHGQHTVIGKHSTLWSMIELHAYLCTVGEHATSSQKGFSRLSDLNKEPSS